LKTPSIKKLAAEINLSETAFIEQAGGIRVQAEVVHTGNGDATLPAHATLANSTHPIQQIQNKKSNQVPHKRAAN